MSEVGASIKVVRNLGNFESIHVDVSFTDTVRNNETDEVAFNRVYEFVEARLAERLKEIEADIKAK